MTQQPLEKKKKTTAKKKKRAGTKDGADYSSQKGNSAHSFKSMKSYILGDLDISASEESNSFEISSNSSVSSPLQKQSLLSSSVKKFQEDDYTPSNYLINDAFISKQSPFSFKNPIFFTCPNNKQGIKINTTQLNCKKQLFAEKAVEPAVTAFDLQVKEYTRKVEDVSKTPLEMLRLHMI